MNNKWCWLGWGLYVVMTVGCGEDGDGAGDGSGGLDGEVDPRCRALCESDEDACAADVKACEQRCQVRVASVPALCGTCLADASPSSCDLEGPCCPDPYFPSVFECAGSCTGAAGENPAKHPECTYLCADDDAACAQDVEECLSTCEARITGVTGLCALCLLEGNSGTCGGDGPCCPDPYFDNSAADCAAVCQ